jgi:hypothetical protein
MSGTAATLAGSARVVERRTSRVQCEGHHRFTGTFAQGSGIDGCGGGAGAVTVVRIG